MGEDYRIIYLTRGWEVKVSLIDYHRFRQFKWYWNSSNSPYAARTVRQGGKKRTVYLHREIVGAPEGLVVNHKDGDTMNCLRSNLEVINPKRNNTTSRVRKGDIPFHGVYFRNRSLGECAGRKNVRSYMWVGDNRVYVGAFELIEEAVRAYDRASVAHFGIYAETNYPLSEYLSLWEPPEHVYTPAASCEEIPF